MTAIFRERGKVLEQNLKDRIRMTERLTKHGEKRRSQSRALNRLRNEEKRLIVQARKLTPPMSQDEIARLTGISQQTVSRRIAETECPTMNGAQNNDGNSSTPVR